MRPSVLCCCYALACRHSPCRLCLSTQSWRRRVQPPKSQQSHVCWGGSVAYCDAASPAKTRLPAPQDCTCILQDWPQGALQHSQPCCQGRSNTTTPLACSRSCAPPPWHQQHTATCPVNCTRPTQLPVQQTLSCLLAAPAPEAARLLHGKQHAADGRAERCRDTGSRASRDELAVVCCCAAAGTAAAGTAGTAGTAAGSRKAQQQQHK